MAVKEKARPPQKAEAPSVSARVFDLLGKMLDNAIDWKIIGILCLTFLIFASMVPAADRKDLKIADFLSILQGDNLWLLVAGVLALLLVMCLGVGSLVVWTQQRRIKQLGEDCARLRDVEQPGRLSSRDNKALAEYPGRAHERHKPPVKK